MLNMKKLALLTTAAMVLATTAGARSGLASPKIQHQNRFQTAQSMAKVLANKLPSGVTVTAKAKSKTVDQDDDDHAYVLKIKNNSSYDITGLYISPSSQEDWGDDLLSDDVTLDAGESVDVTFNPDSEHYDETDWDMQIEVDGKMIEYKNIKLEDDHSDTITLHDAGSFDESGDDDDDN